MALLKVDIAAGQVSGVDDLSPAASSVVNFQVDESNVIKPRAGLSSYSVTGLTTSKIIGLQRWSWYTVLVDSGRSFQVISDFGPAAAVNVSDGTAGTKLEGTKTRVTWVSGSDYVYCTGGGRIQRWTTTLRNTEVISASPTCTHIASIGNYLIANDSSAPDSFRWSDIGEGAWGTWPAANTTTASARPDEIRAIYENANRLFVYGDSSVQVYEVGVDPTLPFDLIGSSDNGIGAPYAWAKLDDQCAWLDHRRRVLIGDGVSGEHVSQAIDRDLRGLTTISDCFMYREEKGQHSLLVVRFPTEGRTFVYNMKRQSWSERKKYTAPFQGDYPVNAYVYRPSDNSHIVASTSTTGALYKIDDTVSTDIGHPLVCEMTTGWQEFDTSTRKRSSRMRLMFRRGTAAQGATPGSLEIRRQDNGQPWSNWVHISAGVPDDYDTVKDIFDLNGVFTRRRYGLRWSNSDSMSIVSLHDDITDLGVP